MKRRIAYLVLLAAFCVGIASAQQLVSPWGVPPILQNASGGGGSFNAAAPGPIGGTTSNTGQFTDVAIGTSVPTLDGTTGNLTAAGAIALGGNTSSGLTAGDILVARAGGGIGSLWLGGTQASPKMQLFEQAGSSGSQLDFFLNANANALIVDPLYIRPRNGFAFSNLPSCTGLEGAIASINDSTVNTVGAIVAGSGTFHVLTYCDGTNWTVASTTGPSARSWLAGASNAVVSNAAANFFPASGTGTAVVSTSEGQVSVLAPTVSRLSNLKCTLTNAAGVATVAGGTNYVMALRQNIASSALTCTIAAAASTCSDNTAAHNVTTAVGDQLDFIDTPTGTPTALVVHCSVEVDS